MILTGKAKENFELWHFENCDNTFEYVNFHVLSERSRNALIIEWFDSVGYIIHTHFNIESKLWGYEIFDEKAYTKLMDSDFYDENIDCIITESAIFSTRKEAATQAIIKANEIYNAILED